MWRRLLFFVERKLSHNFLWCDIQENEDIFIPLAINSGTEQSAERKGAWTFNLLKFFFCKSSLNIVAEILLRNETWCSESLENAVN